MAVDIAGYNNPSRTMAHLREVHEGFWAVLKAGFADTGIPWDACFVENTGDGAMILLPPDIAKVDLAAQLPERMHAGLRRHNAVHSEGAQIQLRLALHAGEVQEASHGSVGNAVSFTFRVLEAAEAKTAQKATGAELALLASDSFYQEVVRHDPAAVPADYRRIPVETKETSTTAWLRLLGAPVNGLSPGAGPAPVAKDFPALVEALIAVPCVRRAESRRLLLDLFSRREIADVVPYHAEDRLHVIALARTCLRFTRGLADLLDAIRMIEPDSPQVTALGALVDRWPERPFG